MDSRSIPLSTHKKWSLPSDMMLVFLFALINYSVTPTVTLTHFEIGKTRQPIKEHIVLEKASDKVSMNKAADVMQWRAHMALLLVNLYGCYYFYR